MLKMENYVHVEEYLTTYKRTNKAGRAYYYQRLEYGIEGKDDTYELMWSGIVSKDCWEWSKMIAEEQPNRLICIFSDMICITN